MKTEDDAVKAKNPLQYLKPRKSMEMEDDDEDTYDKLRRTRTRSKVKTSNNAQAQSRADDNSNGDNMSLRTKIFIIAIFVVWFSMLIAGVIFRIMYMP